jgi:hypothetical protein
MVTDRDISVRAVAAGKGPDTPVRDLLSWEVLFCFDDQELEHVAKSMGLRAFAGCRSWRGVIGSSASCLSATLHCAAPKPQRAPLANYRSTAGPTRKAHGARLIRPRRRVNMATPRQPVPSEPRRPELRSSAGARGAKRGADARGDPEKQKENQRRLDVGTDHRTSAMKRGRRGTFP